MMKVTGKGRTYIPEGLSIKFQSNCMRGSFKGHYTPCTPCGVHAPSAEFSTNFRHSKLPSWKAIKFFQISLP